VRRHHNERRTTGAVADIEAAPGVVTVGPAWMLDPVACAGRAIGAPRVALAALIDLQQLRRMLGFGRSSTNDVDVVREEHDDAATEAVLAAPAPAAQGARCRDAARDAPDRAQPGAGATAGERDDDRA
jgi:hypothetical protein